MSRGVLISTTKISNSKAPQIAVIDMPVTRIGRHGDITMDTTKGREISKHHSTIWHKYTESDDIWVIEDNNSVNGTFLNGKKIRRSYLRAGDEVVFGGGTIFGVGDVVHSTDAAECRYKFYIAAPLVEFGSNIDVASTPRLDPDDVCTICLDAVDLAVELPCGHRFCGACITKWAQVCRRALRPCQCPTCRSSFRQSELVLDGDVFTDGKLIVCSVAPFMKELRLSSLRTLNKISLFSNWDAETRKWYWQSFNTIKANSVWKLLFLHLTEATFEEASKQTTSAIARAMTNLGIPTATVDIHQWKTVVLTYIFKLSSTCKNPNHVIAESRC